MVCATDNHLAACNDRERGAECSDGLELTDDDQCIPAREDGDRLVCRSPGLAMCEGKSEGDFCNDDDAVAQCMAVGSGGLLLCRPPPLEYRACRGKSVGSACDDNLIGDATCTRSFEDTLLCLNVATCSNADGQTALSSDSMYTSNLCTALPIVEDADECEDDDSAGRPCNTENPDPELHEACHPLAASGDNVCMSTVEGLARSQCRFRAEGAACADDSTCRNDRFGVLTCIPTEAETEGVQDPAAVLGSQWLSVTPDIAATNTPFFLRLEGPRAAEVEMAFLSKRQYDCSEDAADGNDDGVDVEDDGTVRFGAVKEAGYYQLCFRARDDSAWQPSGSFVRTQKLPGESLFFGSYSCEDALALAGEDDFCGCYFVRGAGRPPRALQVEADTPGWKYTVGTHPALLSSGCCSENPVATQDYIVSDERLESWGLCKV